MTEEWRDVVGWEGYYQVSNLGRVRSLDRKAVNSAGVMHHTKGKILSSSKVGHSYNKTIFSANGRKETPRICRLVATAFIPNPDNLPQVNHKDENTGNDCADNLEWCDSKYNMNYGTATKRRGLKTRKSVNQYSLDGTFIHCWDSIKDAEKHTGVYHSHISACCKGKLKTSGGFKWEYADNNLRK